MGDNHVSEEYRTALLDLTFNSKPIINVLTMLAEENVSHGLDIIKVICDRIKQVDVDRKLTSLYLLDSILKNIGGDYVNYISRSIVDIFCHVFENATDERKRISLFKLRNTWTQYIPGKVLYDLDVRSKKTDPNWPLNRPSETSASIPQQKKIHVNPKFLQKNEKANSSNKQSTGPDRNGIEKSTVQAKTSKERLREEEQRVQDQLKALQADKVKREREQRELMLRQKQIEREKLLSDQKRQLELLRKQQISMTTNNSNNKNSKQQPLYVNTSIASTNQPSKREPTKDPRLRVTLPSPHEISTGKWGEQLTSPTFSSKVGPKPTHKKKKGAVSVMNKIMTNLSAKKGKQTNSQERTTKLSQEGFTTENADESEASKKSKNSPELAKDKQPSSKQTELPSEKSSLKASKESLNPSPKQADVVNTKSDSLLTTTASVVTAVVSSTNSTKPTVSSTNPPLPFSAAFSGLSSRDMQIAAQAAAIATAMHQMQSATQGTMAPEQSAQLAAQFIKIMQGASTMVSNIPTTVSSTVAASETTATPPTSLPAEVAPETTTKATDSNGSTPESTVAPENKEKIDKPVKEPPKKEQSKQSSKDKHNTEKTEQNNDRSGCEKTKIKTENRKEMEKPVRERSPHDSRQKSVEQKKPAKSFSGEPEKLNEKSHGKSQINQIKSKVRGRDLVKKDSEKLEPPTKKLKDAPTDPNERSRKARARSPSRYYCRIERKMETEKRVEEKEKEMKLQRIRKNSGGDVGVSNKQEVNSNQSKIYQQYINHITELEKRHAKPNSTIKLSTLDSVFKQIQSKFKAGLLSVTENKKLINRLDMFASRLAGEEVRMIDRVLGIQASKSVKKQSEASPTTNIASKDRNSSKEPKDEKMSSSDHSQKDNSVNMNNDPRLRRPVTLDDQSEPLPPHLREQKKDDSLPPPHIRERLPQQRDSPPPHLRDGPPSMHRDGSLPHIRDGLPPQQIRDGPPPHMRDGGLPRNMRDGPPNMRDTPPSHMWDGPPPHMRDVPPRHMRDGPPPHMRDIPPRHMRDGPPPHMRGGPPPRMRNFPPQHMHMRDGLRPPHMMDGPRPHMRDSPPRHMMDGPPRHLMDGPPRHMMDGPPRHMMDGPPRHMMDGPPQHMRDGPPQHMRDGPPQQHMMDGPPQQMRDGPMPPHMMDGPPPHMTEGPPQYIRDGPLPHMMDAPPPHMRDGPIPPSAMEAPPHQHFVDGLQGPCMGEGIPPHRQLPMRNTPPPPHMLENNEGPFREGFMPHSRPDGFNENSSDGSNFINQGPSLNVNSLLGQLMAAGMIKTNLEEAVDVTVPEMPLKIDCLKKRHQSVVQQLFLGMQCSSCGERFPDTQKKQYSDHLDWHFRENRREKDGVRKVSSRSWYHNLNDWVEHSEAKLGDDGKVQSDFFESEKLDKPGDEDNEKFVVNDKKKDPEEEQSVPVAGDEGHGLCGVCNDPLKQYWDEELEEWRFKRALREGTRTYHIDCFKDYVPYDAEEATPSVPTTPRTPGDEPSFVLEEPAPEHGTADPETKVEMEIVENEPETKESMVDNETSDVQVKQPNKANDVPMKVEEVLVKVEEVGGKSDDDMTMDITKEGDVNNVSTIEQNNVDLDNRAKETALDDEEYMDKVDSPEYPLIMNSAIETSPIVAMETDTENTTDQPTNSEFQSI